ncbi:hypothetical protein [Streptacidiphilus sp. EB129]|uniref:hypothetical protein n=1 Tax=Streptacidiphilus sp. EB129 TaxID=3156262 RepID=UPI0035177C10
MATPIDRRARAGGRGAADPELGARGSPPAGRTAFTDGAVHGIATGPGLRFAVPRGCAPRDGCGEGRLAPAAGPDRLKT